MQDAEQKTAASLTLPAGVVRGGAGLPDGTLGLQRAGGLVEVSSTPAHAPWSLAAMQVARAQAGGAFCAWVQPASGELYPPDLAVAGVRLGALVMVRVPSSAGPFGLPRAAEILLASGALGVVVVDTLQAPVPPQAGWQSRLLSLARAAGSTVLVLTEKVASAPSLGALCGGRVEPHRRMGPAGEVQVVPHWLRRRGRVGWPDVAQGVVAPWQQGRAGCVGSVVPVAGVAGLGRGQ